MTKTQLLTLSIITLLAAQPATAVVMNPGFESGTLAPGWTGTGVTSIETAAFGVTPTEGTNQALMTTAGGSVSDKDIETFLGLASGRLDAIAPLFPDADEGSAIKQTFSATAGDVLSFDWNFLTDDSGVADFAFWSLVAGEEPGVVLADGVSATLGASASVFAEETGYMSASHTITTTGTYTLGFGVVDAGDDVGDSGLLVDNVELTTGTSVVPEPSSLVVMAGLGLIWCSLSSIRRRRSALK